MKDESETKAEITEKLGISKDSLQDRLDHARKKIRQFFKGVDCRILCKCKVNFHEPYELIVTYGKDLDKYLEERKPDLSRVSRQ